MNIKNPLIPPTLLALPIPSARRGRDGAHAESVVVYGVITAKHVANDEVTPAFQCHWTEQMGREAQGVTPFATRGTNNQTMFVARLAAIGATKMDTLVF